MNFLELSQSLRREVDMGSGPTAVTSQSGNLLNVVTWIKDAWIDIQLRHEWTWLRCPFSLTISASDGTYAYGDATDTLTGNPITRFRRWRIQDPDDPPKIHVTATGLSSQRWLVYLPWEHFKMIYRIGQNNTTEGPPAHIAIDPQENLQLGPIPNDALTLIGEYIRSAQVLSGNTDTPEIPSDYHMLIVYHAMKKYGYQQLAPEQLSRATEEGRRMMRQLEARYLPRLTLAEPMA